ncbi:MAG: GNAT family N-acetyltransferase, partial [Thermoplasmatota archaeon]
MRKIRKVEEGDIQKVVDIELESLGPLYDSEDINFERGRLKKYLREFMSMDRMIMIEDEDEILGFLHSRSYDDVVSRKKVREILTITIHPEYFGEGLG